VCAAPRRALWNEWKAAPPLDTSALTRLRKAYRTPEALLAALPRDPSLAVATLWAAAATARLSPTFSDCARASSNPAAAALSGESVDWTDAEACQKLLRSILPV
jgi:hypothetical protein